MWLFDLFRRLFGGTKTQDTAPTPEFVRHPLDGTDDEAAYRSALAEALDCQTEAAVLALGKVFEALPDKAKFVSIMVHPSQDPDGLFSVLVHLDGPDLHVLNKAIHPHRTLLDTRVTPTGVVPSVPMFDPFDTAFSVNDVIVDVAADWVERVWAGARGEAISIPASVFGEEGYGPTTPRKLPTAS